MKDMDFLVKNGVDIQASLDIFGDITTYNESLQDFLEEIEVKLTQITQYKEAADMANYAILVHSLKSDAKYFGFMILADLAYQHELESKNNNIYFVTENYESLMKEAHRVMNVAREYLGEEIVKEVQQQKVFNKNKTLLVVDDSTIIRNYVQNIFDETFRVVIATDGQEALNYITSGQDNNIIGLLLDLNMPNVDGFAVLEYFKQHQLFERIPVFIITGENSKVMIERARTYPIIDVLEKPFNERDIKEVVEKTIELDR